MDSVYLGEPYAIAADVSDKGRAGWSWYTGSAGLMYRAILEDMLGISLKNGALSIKPRLPSGIPVCRVEYRNKNALYKIEIKRRENTQNKFLINGVAVGGETAIKLKSEGVFTVTVFQ